MAFEGTDDTAITPDRPWTAVLAQDIAANGQAARDARLRCGSVVWDVRDPPVICGTYSYARPTDGLVRVMQPFIWRRTSLDVDELTIKVRCPIYDGNMTIGAVVLPLDPVQGFPRIIPANTDEATEAARAAAAVTELVVPGIVAPDLDVLVLVTWQSVLVGSPGATSIVVSDFTTMNAEANLDGSPIGSTQRPALVLAPFLKTPTEDWTDGTAPPPKQIIFIDYDAAAIDKLWVYPPFEDLGATFTDLTDLEFTHQGISYAKLYSIQIEETGTSADFPQYGSAFNPGAANSSKNVREVLYRRPETVFLRHTKVHAIGPGAPDPDQVDSVLSATAMQNPVMACARYDANERTIATCYVGPTHRHASYEGVDSAIVSYDVTALLSVSTATHILTNRGTPISLTAYLTLGTSAGGSSVTGDNQTLDVVPMIYTSGLTRSREVTHPIGHLLRLHHENLASAASITSTGLIAHAMCGVFPEDTWYTGAPGNDRGGFVIFRSTITDTSNADNRTLTLRVSGSSVTPEPYVHCVSWFVATSSPVNSTQVGDLSVAL